MKFLIHENLPRLDQFLAGRGEFRFFSGRTPPDDLLLDTQVLLIRSVTKVDQALLDRAPRLQFVGTGTIGTEHVDMPLLAAKGIKFSSAPGANSISVGEYVLAATLNLAQRAKINLEGKRALVIGAGHTGTQAGKRLSALGMEVQYIDPDPVLSRGNKTFVDWAALSEADLVSCHVPLTRDGQWPTYHLFDAKKLARLKAGALLINASRGAVIDNRALKNRLEEGREQLWTALDVWEGEPEILTELVPYVNIATPHIAGHSIEGKVRGSMALANAVLAHLSEQEVVSSLIADQHVEMLEPLGTICITQEPCQQKLHELVRRVYNIDKDDDDFRRHGISPSGFELLRKGYTERRELSGITLKLSPDVWQSWQNRLRTLGFTVESTGKET